MLAVKFYDVNPEGIPKEWPKEVRESTTPIPGYTLMSKAEFQAYIEKYKKDYEAWEKSRVVKLDPQQSFMQVWDSLSITEKAAFRIMKVVVLDAINDGSPTEAYQILSAFTTTDLATKKKLVDSLK